MIRRTARFILDVFGAALAGVAILAALLVWRISTEPVSLAFLSPYLQETLSAEDGSFTIEMDDTILTWAGWERTLDINLVGIRAMGPEGALLASLPEISISLSLRALLRGMAAPTHIEVLRPHINVLLDQDGSFEFDLGRLDDDQAELSVIEEENKVAGLTGEIVSRRVTDLLAPLNPNRSMGYLKRVSVIDAYITVDDRRFDTVWRANATDIILSRNESGILGNVSLNLEGDETAPDETSDSLRFAAARREAHFDLDLSYVTQTGQVDIGAVFSKISPQMFASRTSALAQLGNLNFPLSGTLSLTMNLDGKVPLVGFDLFGDEGVLDLPFFYKDPVKFTQIALRGRVEDDFDRLFLDEAFLDFADGQIKANGLVSYKGDDLVIQGEGVLTDLPFDDLDIYWPADFYPFEREWVTTNLSGGVLPKVTTDFVYTAPGGELAKTALSSISGNMVFDGLGLDYLPFMPKLEKIKGTLSYTDKSMDISVESGVVGSLEISEGVARLKYLDTFDEIADIEFVVRGTARDLLEVVSTDPLNADQFLGVDRQEVGGESASRLKFVFPMSEGLTFDQVEVSAASRLKSVHLPGLILGKDLTEGDMTLRVDKKGMDISGKAVFEGVPAEISGVENFLSTAPFLSRYNVKATLDDAARHRLDLDFEPFLSGPVDVDLIWTDLDGKKGDISIAASLGAATLDFPLLSWQKPADSPSTAQVSLTIVEGVLTEMREFSVKGENLDIAGTAKFTAAGEPFDEVEFTRMISPGNDFNSKITFRADDGLDIDIRGKSLNVAHFFEERDEEFSEFPPLNLSLNVDRLQVLEGSAFEQVSGTFEHGEKIWRSIFLNARMADTGTLNFHILPDGDKRRLTLYSNNAGEFLRRFKIYPNMLVGDMDLSGTLGDGFDPDAFKGELEINGYEIVDAPILAKMLTLTSPTGIVETMSGEGINFDIFSAPFHYSSGVAKVAEGGAFGDAVGLTFEGVLDFNADTADLVGTIIPAYAINSIWGKIPLLGYLLTGEEKGGGVFAATFKVKGGFDNPEITVNPLAALAPGVFRKIFELFGSDGPDVSEVEDDISEQEERENEGAEPPPAQPVPIDAIP
ncbi:MAG: hypothetical protein HOO00_01865 [Rhodospirillaceae bacterium]|nr:hypothetical protein [Rhodospirillaceae bacterium]MBT5374250.1 hypothetical protein [Rhodospirillaceae bacterium]MBT5660419.1 hypothetical protein [Rhodospirillaceae bacterium]MBT5751668.1 hypothetical protein [Rhodospirillaceae bacterium]